ncbi:tetratricopeptide repeat protein [Cetobacterium ceti]
MKRKKSVYILLIFLSACSNNNKINNEKYLLVRGINARLNNEKIKALSLYKKALKVDENNTFLLHEIAILEYENKNYIIARNIYKNILKINKDDEIAMVNLGLIAYKKGHYKECIFYLEKVKNYKYSFILYKVLGISYYKIGNIDKASRNLSEAFLYVKEYDDEYFFISTKILIDKNDKDGLYYFLKKGYNKYLANKKFNILYSDILYEFLKKPKEAEKILKKYLINIQIENDILLKLCEIYIKNNDYIKGKIIFKMIYPEENEKYQKIKKELETVHIENFEEE